MTEIAIARSIFRGCVRIEMGDYNIRLEEGGLVFIESDVCNIDKIDGVDIL